MVSCRTAVSRLLAVVTGTLSLVAQAAAYSDVYVFGDSLSDIGRVLAITTATDPLRPFPAPPDYALGRFSNGAVAVERLTMNLLGSPLTLSHDYAVGGARTGVSPFSGIDNNTPSLAGTGLQIQTLAFRSDVGAGHADPNALYVVWAGANDFTENAVLANAGGTQWARVIGNIETAVGNLAADGARHFLLPNLPNLGLTPRAAALGAATATQITGLSNAYDQLFQQRITSFDVANTSIDIQVFDVYSFMGSVFSQVAANGSYMGISDVTAMCQKVLGCDPAHAFFWDDQHPTAATHALLGDAFTALLVPEPGIDTMLAAGLAAMVGLLRRRRHGGQAIVVFAPEEKPA